MAKFEVIFTTEVRAAVTVTADNEWEAQAKVEDGDIDNFVDRLRDVCYTNSGNYVENVAQI